jgi:TonB-dependent starch-binding outer membrane protein SusC
MNNKLPKSILTSLLTLIFFVSVSAADQKLAKLSSGHESPSFSQNDVKTLNYFISELEEKYKVRFNYNAYLVEGKTISLSEVDLKDKDLLESLDVLLKPFNLHYKQIRKDHYIILGNQEQETKPLRKKSLNEKHNNENKIGQESSSRSFNYLAKRDYEIKSYRQERTVTGQVTAAEDGAGIPGVNIIIKGTSTGSTTDLDGRYSVQVPEDATLVFSFVGYSTREVQVNNRSVIDIVLQTDVAELSEVVVIGYGQQEVRDATGSVASVKAKDFNQGLISSPEQLIQGKTAGVQITTASGEPGAGVNIRIRGTSSVRGGNNPLFVIDGVPLAGNEISGGAADIGRGKGSAKNPLNFLNPSDIESIDILKDASATAIYGSRGANGVVLITTKSGKGQSNTFTYNANTSIAQMANRFDLLNREQFLSGVEQLGADRSDLDFGGNTNWQDEISRTAISHRHDLAYANSFNTGNYRASISYENQQGIIRNTAMERITGRLNFNKSFFQDRLNFGVQATLSRINDEAAAITDDAGFEGDLLGSTYMANPTWENDPEIQISNTNANPLSMLEYYQDNTNTNRALINLSLEFEIVNDLNFRVNYGFDRSHSERGGAYSPELFLSNGIFDFGRGFITENNTNSDLLEAFFDFNKDLGNSKISAVLGYSYQQFNVSGNRVQGWGFNNPEMNVMIDNLHQSYDVLSNNVNSSFQQLGFSDNIFFINKLFPSPETVEFTDRPSVPVRSVAAELFDFTDEIQSFFGRLNYAINDKYLFTVTARVDGSTKFGGNNKYGFFPSAAFAWRLSDEVFIPEAFDDLKLRLGYGVTGNQEIPHNLHQQRIQYRGFNDPDQPFSIGNNGAVNPPGFNDVAFDNPDLQWEQTSQYNIGLDFGFGDGKFSGTLDFYRKVTTDLLIQQFSAQPAPQQFNWINLDADVINSGVELNLNYYAIAGDNFGLDFGFNVSYNDNVIDGLEIPINTGAISGQGLTGAFAQRLFDGQPLYSYYLRKFEGYDSEGISQYEDGDFQQFIGKSPIPTYNLGFTTNMTLGNFDFTVFFNGQLGHYIYNNTQNAFFTKGSLGSGRNVTTDVLNSDESLLNAPAVSTRFLESGDFLRLQNLNIGYNLDLDGEFLKNVRFFVSGQNLFVLTNYAGLDPEVNVNKAIDGVPSLGIDYTAYPRPITVTLGLNATF